VRDKRQEILASEGIGKLLWILSFPAAIGGAVMSLYQIVEIIFVGQVVGPTGIAAVAIVWPVQMLAMGTGQIIGIGGSSLVSRALGAGDIDRAERTLGNAILYSSIIGVLVTIIGLVNVNFWLKLIGASDTILPYAKDYLSIILIGMVFRIYGMGISQLIRAEGNARVAMICMVISSLLSIVLDAIFILVLHMGVRGAAIASVVSDTVTFFYIFHYYRFQNSSLKIHLKNFIPERSVTKEIMTVGFGPFVTTIGGSLVMIILNRTVVTYGGDLAVAAFGMIQRAMMFITLPIMSVSQGVQPIIGFSYGASHSDRTQAAIKLSIIVATIFAFIAFFIIFFFPTPLMRIFTQDSELLSVSSYAARRVFFFIYLVGFQMVSQTIFQALGKAVATFFATVFRQLLFLLPLILVLPRFWQLDGVWLSVPISDMLSFVLTLIIFLREIRNLRRLNLPTSTEQLPLGTESFSEIKTGNIFGGFKTREPDDTNSL
jgi:putative MATE family efflux protein